MEPTADVLRSHAACNGNTHSRLKTIRVDNFSCDMSESDLRQLFSRFGEMTQLYVAKDKKTLRKRGFAFVSYRTHKDADRTMQALQGYGRIRIQWAEMNEPDDTLFDS